MNKLKSIFKAWLPIAVVIVALCALVYASVQQSLRQGANDPQIQMAEDVATVLPAGKVDLALSLAPFVIIYDSTQKVLASSAVLG